MHHFRKLGLGGTFDHFHRGHEVFLQKAAEHADELLIGITSEALTRTKKNPESLESFEVRRQAVKDFCTREKLSFEIVTLTDPYGPTLEKTTVDGLWVSAETKAGADLINTVRHQRHLAPLPILICEMVKDESGVELHSDRIRAGQVSRQGVVWIQALQHDVIVSEHQRQIFSQAQGPVTTDLAQLKPVLPIYVVGDSSLETFITQNWHYTLGIYDRKRAREVVESLIIDAIQPEFTVTNPPGQLTQKLVLTLQKALAEKARHILIDGEEDLAAVALALLAPLNATIVYGQPHQGLVTMTITEKLKQSIYETLTEVPASAA